MITLGWTVLAAIAGGLIWKTSADQTEEMTRPGRLLAFNGNAVVVMEVRSRRPCLTGWRAVCEVVESPFSALDGFDVVVTPGRIRGGFIVPYVPPELAPVLNRAGVS